MGTKVRKLFSWKFSLVFVKIKSTFTSRGRIETLTCGETPAVVICFGLLRFHRLHLSSGIIITSFVTFSVFPCDVLRGSVRAGSADSGSAFCRNSSFHYTAECYKPC